MSIFPSVTVGELLDEGVLLAVQDGNHGEIHPTSADYVESGIPFVMASDLNGNQLDLVGCKFISEARANGLRKGFARPGDVLLTHKGSLGLTDVVRQIDTTFVMLTPQVTYYRPDGRRLDSYFLKYVFRSPFFQGQMFSHSRDGTRPYIGITAQRDLEVLLPHFDVQRRVAFVLKAYDDLIATNQRRIALLEDAVRRLYREWFVYLRFPGHEAISVQGGVPTGWTMRNLFDVCDVAYGFPFKADQFNTNGIGMPAVRIRDIPEVSTSTYTPEEVDSNYIVRRGDFLIGMDGIFHMNYWAGDEALLVQRVCRVRPKDESLRAYVGLALREPVKNFEMTIQGATVAHLGAKHLQSIELLIPDAMDAHLDRLNQALWQQIQLHEVNRKLARARDLLLPKLLSGQFDVSGIPLPEEKPE